MAPSCVVKGSFFCTGCPVLLEVILRRAMGPAQDGAGCDAIESLSVYWEIIHAPASDPLILPYHPHGLLSAGLLETKLEKSKSPP